MVHGTDNLLSVCSSVCQHDISKYFEQIFIKFGE